MLRQRGLVAWTSAACCAMVMGYAAPAWAQFTPGNIVVSQYGDGLTTGTVPIVLREFTTSGIPTGFTVPLPTVNSGPNYAIVSNQLGNTSTGFLKQSVDNRFLTIIGYGTNASASRTIARIDVLGNVNSTTNFSAAGASPRSAITTTGTDLWWSGDTGSGSTGGIRYLTLGSSTSGVALAQGIGASLTTPGGPNPVPFNSRVIGIFSDQLYGSSSVSVGGGAGAYSFRGVFNVGTGLPTTANQLGSIIVGGGTSNSGMIDDPWEFFVADSSTIYVADADTTAPTTAGLQKWLFNSTSGTWSKVWTALPDGATGLRGLTGVVTGSSVQLYGITAASSGTLPNSLVALADTLDGAIPPSFTTLATSDSHYVFRGVAFAPVPEPAAVALGAAGLAALAAAKRIRRRRDS